MEEYKHMLPGDIVIEITEDKMVIDELSNVDDGLITKSGYHCDKDFLFQFNSERQIQLLGMTLDDFMLKNNIKLPIMSKKGNEHHCEDNCGCSHEH